MFRLQSLLQLRRRRNISGKVPHNIECLCAPLLTDQDRAYRPRIIERKHLHLRVRWDARSDRLPPPDNHFQQLYRSHSGYPTYQANGIGLLEGLLPSCTVNRAQSPRRSYGRVVSGHSDGGDLRASTSRRLVRLQQSHGRTTTLRAWRFSQHRVTGEERIGRSTPLPVRPYDDRLAAAITRAAGSRTTRTHSGPPFPARISAETPRRTGHPGATSGVTGAAASPLGHRHNNRPSRCSSECS